MFATEPMAHYIDVRTVAEFVAGRPLLRAVNLPFVFRAPVDGAESENAGFCDLASFLYTADVPLVVGGASDDRAGRAAAALRAAGFEAVSVMAGGFDGWRAARLPTTRDNRAGASYVSVLTRFRRRDRRDGDTLPAH